MGKRYYCDYCDKSFADNPTSRKTHLSGVSHLQNKKAHYDALRDEKEILRDDQNKKPCRAFLSTGECKFGGRCQYSHLTNEDRARLTEIIAKKEELLQAKRKETSDSQTDLKVSLDKWLEKRNKRRKLEGDERSPVSRSEATTDIQVPVYKLADSLTAFPSIPPSLLPPTREEVLKSHYAEWG